MKNKLLVASLVLFSFAGNAQDTQQKVDSLNEVIVTSTRIDIPFSKNSRTIQIVSNQDIKNSGVTNVADLLQQVAGVDVRRRGISGMQADLYIRGGSFDQTLLLIDGIKVEDSQTGHHTMNLALPIEVIERIEIIKGPAARIFGQNAFTGAVNIVTKNAKSDTVILEAQAGNYAQKNISVTATQDLEKSSHIIQFNRMLSDGYRFNTDYDNQNYFVKSSFKTNNAPIDVLATYNDRKFGANGFYATPAAVNQYEETQASLVAVQTKFQKNNITFKPRIYWRRNQDEYIYVRNNPSIYRNLHITNKVGAELNTSIKSSAGTTGFGVDVAKVAISSNNLGARNRVMATIFAEHRFLFLNDKFDVTPGIAVNYFSDFDGNVFPGIDLGYQITDNIRTYANVGQTYRIPTYTDLYYSDPSTLGNENLKQEEAFSQEIGFKYIRSAFDFSIAFFNRDATNLIDYTKETSTDKFMANNIRKLNTQGVEVHSNYLFKMNNLPQKFTLGYTFIEDDIKNINANFSRYSINSAKHQFTSQFATQFIKNISQTVSFRYIERTAGESYGIVDANIRYVLNAFEFSILANNIFNKEYTEQNLIPMPKGNMMFGLKYNFR
jgi:vitamin B12 transporter